MRNKKSLIKSYLLWFFLGVLGAHRLYLGQPKTAGIMFILAGIVGLSKNYSIMDFLFLTHYFISILILTYSHFHTHTLSHYLFQSLSHFLSIALALWWLVDAILIIILCRNKKALEIEFKNDMKGIEYEHFVAQILRKQGWTAEVTKASGDKGMDVYAAKGVKTLVVQCKRYNGSVGITAVQEISAGKIYVGAKYAAVVTNSRYTRSAKELADGIGVHLLHHDDLSKLDKILKHQPLSIEK